MISTLLAATLLVNSSLAVNYYAVPGENARVSSPSSETSTSSSQLRIRRDQLKEERIRLQEDYKLFREEKQQEIKQKKEELQTRLREMNSEGQTVAIENINNHLETLNQRWVNHWNNVLSRLVQILGKLENRNQDDNQKINSAIESANTAINEAQSAVNDQAAAVYVVEIEANENLGQAVRRTVSLLKNDLKLTRQKVQNARDAVVLVLREIKANEK